MGDIIALTTKQTGGKRPDWEKRRYSYVDEKRNKAEGEGGPEKKLLEDYAGVAPNDGFRRRAQLLFRSLRIKRGQQCRGG